MNRPVYGLAVAALLALVSVLGLTLPATYARETTNWATQAIAQDWFDLVITVPAIVVAAALAARGSRRAQVALAGLLLFAVYTLAIYCFAVHLNRLFLLYCAAFGASLYALIAHASRLQRTAAVARVAVPRRVVGCFLLVVAAAFGALWLAQLVPAARAGTVPRELVETGLLTNPIHVLDLSFILPLHVIAGVALLQRRPIGLILAPALLAFVSLMAASIAFLLVMLEVRGLSTGGAPVAVVMAVLATAAAAQLVWMTRAAPGPRRIAPQPLHL